VVTDTSANSATSFMVGVREDLMRLGGTSAMISET
jgi:hypothetical protein